MSNLKCPCCNQEPSVHPIGEGFVCRNSKCLLVGLFFFAKEYNNPALRIAEHEAEKRGWNEAINAALKAACYKCANKDDKNKSIKSLLK